MCGNVMKNDFCLKIHLKGIISISFRHLTIWFYTTIDNINPTKHPLFDPENCQLYSFNILLKALNWLLNKMSNTSNYCIWFIQWCPSRDKPSYCTIARSTQIWCDQHVHEMQINMHTICILFYFGRHVKYDHRVYTTIANAMTQ